MGERTKVDRIGGGVVSGVIVFAILYFAIGLAVGQSIFIGCLWIFAAVVGALRQDESDA